MFFLLFSCFLINTADRIIRVYDGREILTCGRDGEPEPMQKLQDLVNRYLSETDFIYLTAKCIKCKQSSANVKGFSHNKNLSPIYRVGDRCPIGGGPTARSPY